MKPGHDIDHRRDFELSARWYLLPMGAVALVVVLLAWHIHPGGREPGDIPMQWAGNAEWGAQTVEAATAAAADRSARYGTTESAAPLIRAADLGDDQLDLHPSAYESR